METFTHIINGFAVCMTPINLWYTFLGVFLGTIIGVLPGIGPSAGMVPMNTPRNVYHRLMGVMQTAKPLMMCVSVSMAVP